MARNDGYVEIIDEIDETEDNFNYNTHKSSTKGVVRRKRKLKWWFIVGFIILAYLFYDMVLGYVMSLLKLNPVIYKLYLGIEYEIANNTLKGLLFVSIMGSLFFLALPSEALFLYYLSSTKYLFLIVIGFLVIGNLIGLIFNYFFGRILGERVVRFMFKKSFDKYQEKIDNWGGLILFFGNIFPGPVELLTVFYGGFKFKFSRYVFLCFMGRLIKYVILFLLYVFFWDQISGFYADVLKEFAKLVR